MARRKVEKIRARIKATTDLVLTCPTLWDNIDMGKNWVRYEYECHLNSPEIVRVTVIDPHQTIFNKYQGKYYGTRQLIPIYTQAKWVPSSPPKLELTQKEHVITGCNMVAPGEGGRGGDQTFITFTCMDIPHYILAGGDAGGYVYEGRISDVVPAICKKYSRGEFKTSFATPTKDDKHNKWYQNRMYPLAFVKSLLRWSSSLSKQKTRWIFHPDTDKGKREFKIKEQKDWDSKHRSTYYFGADPSMKGHGDILNFEMKSDEGHDMSRGKIVTSGISTLSGAYHDRIVHWKNKDIVYVDEKQTSKKFVQRSWAKREAYLQPATDEPLQEQIGWTRFPSVPELPMGEMGLKYIDYIDGYARGGYYRDTTCMQRITLEMHGHHIWTGSYGLGSDTIDIMMRCQPDMRTHVIHGNWIVDGFKHVVSRKGWITYLYCHRFHYNAKGKEVGKINES